MEQTDWGPSGAGIAASGVLGVLLATAAVTLVIDLPGRVLVGVAGLALVVFATASWRARPKLAITDAGLVVRGWWRSDTLGRDDIDLIRITEFQRWGRTVRLLEIDTRDDRLFVFTRWDLGADPRRVLDVLADRGWAGA
ncbi:PH domain-containing protein [uncultured Mycolicibacterium sp.]|uniref:PH domain-containing protein n=1 Tax=uncultured Mycolicibacterium sp. TaxID=2320817 RepID=UPI00261741D5|nr:PH domain-containing protein [uncultured Mycolicibacterium sp.]